MPRKSAAATLVAPSVAIDTADAGATNRQEIGVRFRSDLAADDPEAVERFAEFCSLLCQFRRADEAAGIRFVDESGNTLQPL